MPLEVAAHAGFCMGVRRAVEMAVKLEARGFLVPAIRYPTVAKGAARLRVSVSARTTEEDMGALASAIAAASFQLRRID